MLGTGIGYFMSKNMNRLYQEVRLIKVKVKEVVLVLYYNVTGIRQYHPNAELNSMWKEIKFVLFWRP